MPLHPENDHSRSLQCSRVDARRERKLVAETDDLCDDLLKGFGGSVQGVEPLGFLSYRP